MALTLTNDILKFRESTSDPWERLLIQANMNFNLIYPVGSIYMSTVDVDPGTIFGGTWERLKDKFLLGAGTNYTAGDTGGEAEHTLTVDEMPSHRHNLHDVGSAGTGTSTYGGVRLNQVFANNFTNYVGGGQAHNNMPPYIVVYMWKRLTLSPSLTPLPMNVLGDVASQDIVPVSMGGTGADNAADARANLGVGEGVETFDLTTSLSGFQGHGIFDKATNTVRIFCSGSYASNLSASTNLFNVPSDYRPSTTVYGVFMCMTSSGYTSGNLYIEANGNISQGATNYLRAIIGFAEYKLNN